MSIYSSSKVMPYVYKCIHRETGKIYIGCRVSNKLPSTIDFGSKYRTSSNHVKPIFDEFDWYIVAEFFDKHDAYNFEQQMIHEQWQVSKEMSLNKRCDYDKVAWNNIGNKHSEEHNRKISNALRGKPRSEKAKQNLRKPKPPRSEEHNRKLGDALRGRPQSKSHIRNSSNIIDVLTPDGFVIENTTMKELCSQFNLVYGTLAGYFRNGISYKGFTKI